MRKIVILMVGLLVFAACESDWSSINVLENVRQNNKSKYVKTISPETAIAQAIEFRESILGEGAVTRSGNSGNGVASVYAWQSTDISSKTVTRSTVSGILPDTLLYIVNFENNSGYALVSANDVVPGVVAYVETGSLTPDDEIEIPGIQAFLEGYEKFYSINLEAFGGIADSLEHLNDSMYLVGDTATYVIERPQPVSSYRLLTSVGPLLRTSWSQDSPYNNLCPIFDPNIGFHCKAGCVAIAIAQVAAYYERPASYNGHTYNWQAINLHERITDADTIAANSVANLVHDIGQLVNMKYGGAASGAQFDSIRFCLDAFDYHYTYTGCLVANFDAVKADILNHRPVIICGRKPSPNSSDSHAWVIDGLIVKRHRFYPFVPQELQYRNYVHCNWGWNGMCNGYFMFQAFDVPYNTDTDTPVTGLDAHLAEVFCGYNFLPFAYYAVYPND